MDIMARWEQFNVPWTRRDGQRLLATGDPQYAVREDLSGRLVGIRKDDMIVGRDERRVARKASQALALHMLVKREDVIGKGAKLKTRRARAVLSQCRVVDGKIVKPPPFVTYQTQAGLLYRRLEVGECHEDD